MLIEKPLIEYSLLLLLFFLNSATALLLALSRFGSLINVKCNWECRRIILNTYYYYYYRHFLSIQIEWSSSFFFIVFFFAWIIFNVPTANFQIICDRGLTFYKCPLKLTKLLLFTLEKKISGNLLERNVP